MINMTVDMYDNLIITRNEIWVTDGIRVYFHQYSLIEQSTLLHYW